MAYRWSYCVEDADTGEEIIVFLRRKKYYIYLRDKYTKRFIKKLDYVEKRVFACMDYTFSKKHPLYIDIVVKTLLKGEHFRHIDDIEDKMITKCFSLCLEFFGRYVEQYLEIVGIEFGSRLTTHTVYPFAKWIVVWHHGDRRRTRKREGELRL